ncbi:hypothetical protein BSKO_05337 [Bryopsis sp. KO-2023]|nr:hypothetical protein BSKO_05337 [Bryopsis sp. KO-2023]
MYGLHVSAIQEPTVVQCAVGGSFSKRGRGQVLVNRQNSLQLWETTSGDLSPIDDGLPVHEFVQHIARITVPGRELDAFLTFTSDDKVSLSAWNGTTFTRGGTEPGDGGSRELTVCLGLEDANDNGRPKGRRVDGIKVSGASPARRVSGVKNETWKTNVAAEAYYGWLHLVQVAWEEGVGWTLDVEVTAVETGGEDDSTSSVLDLEFGWNSSGSLGEPLGVVYMGEDNMVCLSIFSICENRELGLMMNVRNVDPTTTLLMAIPEDASLRNGGPLDKSKGGLLVIGSHTVSLLSFPFGADIEHTVLIQWKLAGIATCGEFVGKGRWVIGDSSGGMTLLFMGNEPSWYPISRHGFCSVPLSLAFAPEASEELSGLLFVGSRIGNSQVLAVPSANKSTATTPLGSEVHWTITQPTAIENIGPINDMITVKGLPGIAEQQTLICSGRYPCGSLRRACLSMGVEAVITDGPVVQDGVRLFAVEARASDGCDSYLCFSYEAASRTDVMSIADTHFKPVRIPGFNHESSSILVKMGPHDCMVQVTPKGVHAITDCSGDSTDWKAPGSVSLAGLHEDAAVLAIGADLLSLSISSKGVAMISERKMPQQISGIHVAPLSSSMPGQVYVVVGQWVSNTIHVLSLTSLQDCCEVELPGFQPRSFGFLAVRDLGFCLLVGTGSGAVGVLELFRDSNGALSFGDSRMVEVGTVGVEVCHAPGLMADSDCIVAICEQVAIFHVCPYSSNLLDGVEPVRLYLGEGCRALACISSKAIARGLAWVSSRNQLIFGSLCTRQKLRWMSAMIGETPVSAAFHSESGCFVVLTEGAMGAQWLRLVDGNTLRPSLPGMQLDSSHSHCGVLVARLPCSSNMQLGEDGWKEKQEPWKEFVVLWSYIVVREGSGSHTEASQGLISFFEIVSTMVDGGLKVELRLHGSCALSTIPHSCVVANQCLGSMDPDDEEGMEDGEQDGQKEIIMQVTESGSAELHWSQNWPIVLVGGQLDITAHRFFVDDANILGVKVVDDLIKRVPKAQETGSPGDEVPHRMADSTRWDRLVEEDFADGLIEAARKAIRRDWRQGVISKTVGSAGMRSPVVSLAEIEGMVVAQELLGSLTVFRNFVVKIGGQKSPLWTPLIPLSADRSSLSVQAVIPLTKSMFLVSVHPFGFVVLHHDGETTKEQVRIWREQVLQNFEGGRQRRAGPPEGDDPPAMEGQDYGSDEGGEGPATTYLFHSVHNLNSLMVGASCRIPQLVGGFCSADLGMKLGRIGSDMDASGASQPHRPSALYFTAGGMVGLCRVIPAEDGEKLADFQKNLQSRQAARELPLVSGHNHSGMFEFLGARGQAGVCLDSDFINRGLRLEEGGGRDVAQLWRLNNPRTSCL